MTEQKSKYRIFISAAEPSADAHCAGLITALKQTLENLRRGHPEDHKEVLRMLINTGFQRASLLEKRDLTELITSVQQREKARLELQSGAIDLE